jgi:hypothetical protein
MRVARAVQAGRGQASLQLFSSNSIFRRKLPSVRTLASDQTPALKFANQCNYSNPNYSYNGSPAPSFYGYSGTGYGNFGSGHQAIVNFNAYTTAFYVVDGSVPTQTVTWVNFTTATTWTAKPPGAFNNFQAGFNAVPVPDVTQIPQGQVWPAGTDRATTIWRPSTNELWEMWRLYGSPGSYIFGYGGYMNNVTDFNGIWPNTWGTSASSIALDGGMISIQDVIDVLHGLPIQHALKIAVTVAANAFVPPATRNDSSSSTPQYDPDGITPNPAYGFVDAVAEGTWFAFPASFNPTTAMPGAGPLALAIATAFRDYGLVVTDGSGVCTLDMEDPRVLGSPYSYAKVNSFAGSTGTAAGYYDSYINNNVPGSWTDSTLPKVTEVMTGPSSVLSQIPWQQLQVLQPFSS